MKINGLQLLGYFVNPNVYHKLDSQHKFLTYFLVYQNDVFKHSERLPGNIEKSWML